LGKSGRSHFGYVDEGGRDTGWHITTDIPKLGVKEGFDHVEKKGIKNGYSHHDFLSDFKY